MKLEQSLELKGIKATLSFEIQPEAFVPFPEGQPDQPSASDTSETTQQAVFSRIPFPSIAHDLLHQAHDQLYQNLVTCSLDSLMQDKN